MNEERPNFTVKMVCLANSRKTGGRCVAGKILDAEGKAGKWIRPVGASATHEISELDLLLPDGEMAGLLDILEIPGQEQIPQGHQPENTRIDPRFFWQRRGQISWEQLQGFVDHPAPLWVNGFSTYQGRNNRIPEDRLDSQSGSLRLIALDQLVLHTGSKLKSGRTKPVVQASFDYLGENYCLDATDPVIEGYFFKSGSIEHPLSKTLVCVSLTELWEGYVYKLAASIITPKRAVRHD